MNTRLKTTTTRLRAVPLRELSAQVRTLAHEHIDPPAAERGQLNGLDTLIVARLVRDHGPSFAVRRGTQLIRAISPANSYRSPA